MYNLMTLGVDFSDKSLCLGAVLGVATSLAANAMNLVIPYCATQGWFRYSLNRSKFRGLYHKIFTAVIKSVANKLVYLLLSITFPGLPNPPVYYMICTLRIRTVSKYRSPK
jgi:hypothetical protein